MLWTSLAGGRKVVCALSSERPQDLVFIRELVEAGKIKSIVDRRYPLEQAAEAHRYFESGDKKGKVILTVI
jgi:NADPH:quinone reductase-like Zn-dependent oxidoreductase